MDTFVVRVWRSAEPEPVAPESLEPPLRGLLEHVGTGAVTRFGGGAELLRLLRGSPPGSDSEGIGNPVSTEEGDSR